MIAKKAVLIFAIGAALILPACSGPNAPQPENTPSADLMEGPSQPVSLMELEDAQRAFETALNMLYYENMLPDLTYLGDSGYPMEDNFYAVCDVDSDGRDELIIEYSAASMSARTEAVYGYDNETGWLREEFMQFPDLTYYDNGIIKARFSRNQGLAGRFWPYFLYKYNSSDDLYECIAMADAWDGSIHGEDYDGRPFPNETDVSGDGIVYYLLGPDDTTLGDPVDKSEYEAWVAEHIGGARELTLPKIPLEPETFSQGAKGTAAIWVERSATERNYYSETTSLSKAQVECFALEVRRSILEHDWQALAEYTSFPLFLNGGKCPDRETLIAMAPELLTQEDFVAAVVAETCEEMFFNYEGIMMADGRVHLGEIARDGETGELYVMAINTTE